MTTAISTITRIEYDLSVRFQSELGKGFRVKTRPHKTIIETRSKLEIDELKRIFKQYIEAPRRLEIDELERILKKYFDLMRYDIKDVITTRKFVAFYATSKVLGEIFYVFVMVYPFYLGVQPGETVAAFISIEDQSHLFKKI